MLGILKVSIQSGGKISLLSLMLAIFFFCVPLMTINIGGSGLMLIVSSPIILLCMWEKVRNRRRFICNSHYKRLLGFMIFVFLTTLWATNLPGSFVYELVKKYGIVLLLSAIVLNENEKIIVELSLIFSALFISYSMITGGFGYTDGSERATVVLFGIPQDPNYVSLSLIPACGIAMFWSVHFKHWIIKACMLCVIALILYTELLMGCRGGAFSCLLIMILILTLEYGISIKTIIFLALGTYLISFMFPFIMDFLPDSVAHRFSVEMLTEDGAGGRTDLWKNVLTAIEAEPFYYILGQGVGMSNNIINSATHNYPLQLLLEVGVVGFGCFAFFSWKFLKYLWHYKVILSFAILASVLFMSLSLSVNTNMNFWANIALVFLLCNNNRKYSR